jgi:hypothetical protein
MKICIVCVLVLIATLALAGSAQAVVLQVYTETDPIQDDWAVNGWVHELGTNFPAGELISATNWLTTYVPCQAEYGGGTNLLVQITNLTGVDWTEVYYVADPETSLSNWDELVGQVGTNPACLAFKIDSFGENTPLVYESMGTNDVFEAGETWRFVIQEYVNALGGPPDALDSLGVAGASSGYPPSTGSIIAIPEPSSIALAGLSGLLLTAFARRRTR